MGAVRARAGVEGRHQGDPQRGAPFGRGKASFSTVSTSSGRRVAVADSRESKLTPSVTALASRKLTGPSPVTAGVTSHSVHTPVEIAAGVG